MEYAIETRTLSKRFGTVRAVANVSIRVKKGEIYGFLGLNGAGKTTTIRMLLGMIRPSAGVPYIMGKKADAANTRLWDSVGYLVEIPYAYPTLTVRENLELFRRLRFITDPHAVEAIIEKLKLGAYRDRPAKNLSLGNAQRLGLAKALLHNPEILILDEPANGLDPAGIVEIREMLLDLACNNGVTIFISSHILGEISRFATRIGIIHEGRIIRETSTEQMDRFRRRVLQIRTRNNKEAARELAAKGYPSAQGEDGDIEISDPRAVGNPEKINSFLVGKKLPPYLLKVDEEDLESYFLRVINENGGAA